MDLGKIQRLQQQAAIARAARQQQNTHKAKLPPRPHGVAFSYDADSGLDIIRLSDGSTQYAVPDTSGVRSPGEALVVRTGGGTTHIDTLRARQTTSSVAFKKFIPKTVGNFLFMNTILAVALDGNSKNWERLSDPTSVVVGDYTTPDIFDGANIHDIYRSKNIWIAVGEDNPNSTNRGAQYLPIAISTDKDHKTWILSTQIVYTYEQNQADTNKFGGDVTLLGIAYGNEIYVAVGDWGRIWISSNGINWIQTRGRGVDPYSPTSSLFDYTPEIKFANGYFLIGTDTGLIKKSTNGIDWITVYQYPDQELNRDNYSINRLVYGNNTWVAIGRNIFFQSNNGDEWNNIESSLLIPTSQFQAGLAGLAFGKDKFVAGATAGTMAYSFDGSAWTNINSPFPFIEPDEYGQSPSNINAIGYDQKVGWLAIAENGDMAVSSDGITWKDKFTPSSVSDSFYFTFIRRIYSKNT